VSKPILLAAAKLAITAIAGCVAGLAFGILPCYVFPIFGASGRDWCGFKSEPPHFVLQFWLGFVLAAIVVSYFAFRTRR